MAYSQVEGTTESLQKELSRFRAAKKALGVLTPELRDTVKINILSKLIKLNYSEKSTIALGYVKEQLKSSQDIDYKWGIADAYENYGNIYEYLRNYDLAVKFYLKALPLYKAQENNIHIIDIHNNLGILYTKKGIYLQAQEHFFAALALAKKINDQYGQVGSYNNIGLIYREQNKLRDAIKYYNKSIELQLKNPVEYKISYTYLNIAEIYRLKKDYALAEKNIMLGIEAAINEKDNISVANNYSALGNLYVDMGRLDAALQSHDKAFAIRKEVNDGFGLFTSYMAYSSIYSKTGRPNEAIVYANKALELVKSGGEFTMLSDVHKQLANNYKKIDNYKEAYNNHVAYKMYSDSIFNLNNERKLTEQRLNFEFKEIHARSKADAEAALEKQRRMRIISILGLAAAGIFIIVYIVRRHNRRARKSKKEYSRGIHRLKGEISVMEIKTETLKIENENIQLRNDLIAAEKEQERAEREKLQEKLDYNKRELASTALYLFQKNQILADLQSELEGLKDEPGTSDKYNKIKSKIQQNLYLDADWEKFKLHFEQVHPDFFSELKERHPKLTAYEIRLYAYLHMKLSTKEIAGLLNISPASVIKAKVRLNKKLNNQEGEK